MRYNTMTKPYVKTWHLKADIDLVKEVIVNNKEQFFCPFSNIESYLNIYEGRDCAVQFFNLQSCDYSKEAVRDGIKYIKYLMSVERKLGNTDKYQFLKDNYDKFIIETNEENFIIPYEDSSVKKLLHKLNSDWAFDAGSRPRGDITRARIVKLPAGGVMPYHRDETASKNIRVICPIITDKECVNAFKDIENGEQLFHFPATGHFYTFEEDKIEHAVFNNSKTDRYALIFTVVDISDMKAWDRNYYKNKMFWKAWSRGI